MQAMVIIHHMIISLHSRQWSIYLHPSFPSSAIPEAKIHPSSLMNIALTTLLTTALTTSLTLILTHYAYCSSFIRVLDLIK
jgi:hypothetical protein